MTFDPETLYAKPEPGRGIRPAVFVAGGVALAATVLGIVTRPYWWPDTTSQIGQEQPIKSSNSNTPAPPLNFQEHYSPAVYAPPVDNPKSEKEPSAIPAPRTAGSYGPPKKKGIPDEERMSSVITGTIQGQADTPAQGGSQQRGYQQVADSRGGRQGFYGAAGATSDIFRPTGIVGQLGRCSLRPGSYIFHQATGVISSSTPGQVTAQTTRPIYAGPRGDCYASPAGATLVGTYNADTSYGDERLQLAWTALILPNGRMIDLGGMPGAGGDGAAGLPADVNNHIGALAGAVLAGTAVDVIRGMASFGGGGNDNVVVNLGGALADRSASVAERLVDRELNRRPTLTAKAQELTVQVTRPIELEPYRD
jgi:type IV secretory pathway VirB10-like protein